MAESPFVGRLGELDGLGRVIRGEPGAAAVAVVTGDAGMGKTRLVTEVVRATPDVHVLSGACLPLSESLPYGAITDAFADMASPSGRPVVERALAGCAPYVRQEIAALIPALADGHSQSLRAAPDRTRLFTAVRDLLAATGAERRTVLAVEDLHWADLGTLDLLTFLVRRLPPGTAVVATSRRDELGADNPAVAWLTALARVPGVEQITMAPLRPAHVVALVASIVEQDPADAFVSDVLRRGEGNPFFTEQLVAAARDVGQPLEVPPGVPPGVAHMLLGRVRSTSVAAAEVAAALAVAARPLSESELAVCVGSGVDVTDGVRELLASHLVDTAEHDRYRLRHALLEDTVREDLLGSQRAALHAGVAGVLAARAGEAPTEIAAHWGEAGHRGEEASWSVAAARYAEGLFAWQEASTSWRRVWELWSSLPDDEKPDVDLADAVVGCVRAASRVDLASDRSDSFLALAREALVDERVSGDDYATARLLHAYGSRLSQTDMAAGTAAVERAVALFERAGRPSAEHALAISWIVSRRRLDGVTTGTEDDELARAAAIAERGSDLGAVFELAAERGTLLVEAGRVEEGLAVLARAQARAIDTGAGSGQVAVACAVTDCCLWLLRLRDGVDAGQAAIALAVRAGERESFGFSILVTNTVACLLLLGDTDAAAALVDDYRAPEVTVKGWALHLDRAELDLLAGDVAAAILAVEQHEAINFNNEELWLWLVGIGAAADLWSGHGESARDRVDRVMARIRSSSMAARAGSVLPLGAWAAADLADADPALDRAGLAQRLQEWADASECFAANPGRVLGTAYGTTFDAELARLRRSGQEAAWQVAKDTWAAHLVPHHAAYAGWRLAEQFLDTGRRKDAEAELNAAHVAAETHLPLRAEIENLARRARLSLRAQKAVPAAPGGTAEMEDNKRGLTPRELEVLELLTAGRTNREIGQELYMSPKTASVHVSRLMQKLGVTSRVQAAAMAHRLGIDSAADGPVPAPDRRDS